MIYRAFLCICVLVVSSTIARAGENSIDPLAVRREGPAYRYPQAGWIVVHVEGTPYERGVQQGKLLSREIADYVRCFAEQQSPKAPADGWRLTRTLTEALFTRRFDPELLEEMKGIADGASAAGAKFDSRPLDLTDIVAINAWSEIITLDDALRAQPNGLEGKDFGKAMSTAKPTSRTSRCSAFAATGPATKDGKAVIGHITMFDIYPCNFFNVWLDVKPTKGHRVVIQGAPGSVQSGMDWYINDAGMVLTETTIAQTKFNPTGQSIGSRSRMAMQYGDSIDSVVKLLGEHGNGLYTNEWILADGKTNEIALFELGTNTSRLMRSSMDEWFGNTRGFYWGCNNTKDTAVRLETINGTNDRPADMTFCPQIRDVEWVKLFNENVGKIDASFGKLAFGKPPLAARESCDAKYTTAQMAREMKSFAHWGDPAGQLWEPKDDVKRDFPSARPIMPNDWTVLTVDAPAGSREKSLLALDFKNDGWDVEDPAREDDDKKPLPEVVWHGTLLPASNADLWLASSFSHFHDYVAHERELRRKHEKDSDGLTPADRDELAVQLFNLGMATAAEGGSCGATPLRKLKFDPSSDAAYRSAAGRGVMLLSELRRRLAPEVFDAAMDAFGKAHGGKATTSEEFVSAMMSAAGGVSAGSVDRSTLAEFFRDWLDSGEYLPVLKLGTVRTMHRDGYVVSGSVSCERGSVPGNVDVTVEGDGAETTRTIAFDSSGTAHFKIEIEGKPDRVTVNKYFQTPCANAPVWTTSSYKRDLEHTLIVYGTRCEGRANEIAAGKLRQAIIDEWHHTAVPVKSDSEVSDADLKSHHLLLVGRPVCSDLIGRLTKDLPVTFGIQSFALRGRIYGHELSALLIAGPNPLNPACSVIELAGMSTAATLKAAEALPGSPPSAARVLAAHAKAVDVIPPTAELTRALQ